MSRQTNNNGYIAYKEQAGLGVQASGAGATVLRVTGGTMNQTVQPVPSGEVRRDALTTLGGMGSRRATGQYNSEVSIGLIDTPAAHVMRGAWTAAVTIDEATVALASATLSVSGNVITFSGGSVITAGVRAYDVVTFSEGLAAGDLGKPLRLTGVTATSMTVAETITDVAGPVANYTFKKERTLINPLAGALIRKYVTVEEREEDTDGSKVFTDARFGQLVFGLQPNGMFTLQNSLTGTGKMDILTGGSSPLFTSPTETTASPLTAAEVSLRLGTEIVADLTTLNLQLGIGLTAPDVAGNRYSPDVANGPFTIQGSVGLMKQDWAYAQAAQAEDILSLHILAQPADGSGGFVSLVVPRFKIPAPSDSELSRQAGFRTQTINLDPGLVGIDTRGGAYDRTMAKFAVSNAS